MHTLLISRRNMDDASASVAVAATSITLAVQLDAREGDYLLAHIAATGVITYTTPDGWTLLDTQDVNGNLRSRWYYKWATAFDAGEEYTWTVGAGADLAGAIVAYPGVDPTNPVVVAKGASAAGTVHVTPSAAVVDGGWAITAAAGRHNTTGVVTGWSSSDGLDERVVNEGSAVTTPDISHAIFDSDRALSAGSVSRTLTATQSEASVAVWTLTLRPATITYPEAPLQHRVRVAFGANPNDHPSTWAWTDVTQWWHPDDEVQIRWGRSEGSTQAEASEMTLTLVDTDGRFTAHDPRSPYWPNVIEGVPIDFAINAGAGWRTRFGGSVYAWPLEWPGRSRHLVLARIKCNGIFRRMGAADPPEPRALRRAIKAGAVENGTIAYWPCDDGEGSTQVASGLSGGAPMQAYGDVIYEGFDPSDDAAAAGQGFIDASGPVADLKAGGRLVGVVPQSTRTPIEWTVSFRSHNNPFTDGATIILAEWLTPGGTYARWQFRLNQATSREELVGITSSGTATVVLFQSGITTGGPPNSVTFHVRQNGANVDVVWGQVGFIVASTTLVAHTLARVTEISGNPANDVTTDQFPFCHVMVADRYDAQDYSEFVLETGVYYDPDRFSANAYYAFYNEPADTRIGRVFTEDQIPIVVEPMPDPYLVRMWTQKPESTLTIARKCEVADGGLLTENGHGVHYVPRGALYKRPVGIVIDVAQRQLSDPFAPVHDDARKRNSWEVKRDTGSTAVFTNQAHANRYGLVRAGLTVHTYRDDTLMFHAQWLAAVGTVEELRYPAIGVNLHRTPALIQQWLDVRAATRVQLENLLPQHPPGGVDQLVVGGTETFKGSRIWRGTMNGVPARLYDVWTVEGDGNSGRLDTGGSELAAAVTDSATSLLVTTPNRLALLHPVWTVDPADMPFDLDVDGELMTATAITSALKDTYARTAAGLGSVEIGGVAYALSGGTVPGDYSTSGGTARFSLGSVNVTRSATLPVSLLDVDFVLRVINTVALTGASMTFTVRLRYVDASNFVDMRLGFTTANTVTMAVRQVVAGVETVTSFPTVYQATNTTALKLRVQAFGSRLRGKAWLASDDQEPPAWPVALTNITHLTPGQIQISAILNTGNTNALPVVVQFDDLETLNPQTVTVTRGAQDWTAAHDAGDPVRLYRASPLAR